MRILFVLSSHYAGSHLLSAFLDGHSACAAVGELRDYRRFRNGEMAGDEVESDYLDHPLFADLESMPESAWHRTLLQRLQQHAPSVTTLIDNSKRTGWTKRSMLRPDTQAVMVHLLRDPRALIHRWLEDEADPQRLRRMRLREASRQWWRAPTLLLGPDVDLLARRWLRINQDISRFISAHAPGSPTVTYLELVQDPEATLRRLMPAFGLEFEPAQLDLASRRPLGTRKRTWMQQGRNAPLQPDMKWRFDLTDFQQRRIDGLAELHDYLDSLGLRMGSRGLERIA